MQSIQHLKTMKVHYSRFGKFLTRARNVLILCIYYLAKPIAIVSVRYLITGFF